MKAKKSLLILGAAILSFGATSFLLPSNKAEVAFATYTNHDGDTYYNGISTTKSGNDLLEELRALNSSKRRSTVGYDSMGTTASDQFRYTDYDEKTVQYDSNGQPYGTRISSFYTYTSATSFNREHVWPNSHGGGKKGDIPSPYPDADIHMTRPTISSENSSRGNSFFVEGMNHSENGWDPYTAGYSANSRGEAARITFYTTLLHPNLVLAPNNTTPSGKDPVTGVTYGSGHTMGNLESLIKWNINHPVTNRERNRNEGAEYLQGNRNPFVDHPEYACRIWGNVNSKIKTMCDNASWDTGDSISISKTTVSLNADDTTQISATASDNSSITWTNSNNSVLSLSSTSSASGTAITITALGEGSSTITAKATINSELYTATCVVTVNQSGGGDTPVVGSGTVTVDSTISGLTSDDSSAIELTSETIAFGAKAKKFNNNIVWLSASSGYLYNKTNLGKITKVTISYASGGSTTACQALSFSNDVISGHQTSAINGTTFTTSSSAKSNSYVPTSDYGYFNLSITNNKNLQATSIEIEYESGESPSEDPILSSVSASGMTTSYNVGDTFSFDGVLTATYSDDSTKEVTPTSVSTPDMSTAGTKTVTISYTEGGVTKTTTYDITVNAVVVSVTGVTLNKTSTSIEEGSSETLTASVLPSNATNKNVTWSTSNSEVATVNNGIVNAVKAGTATITVTTVDGNKTASCVVTVTEKVVPTPTGDYSLTDKSPYINGIPYKMYFNNTSTNNTYYFNGSKSGNYGATTTTAENAVDVYFEESGSGQNIYFDTGSGKQYLSIVVSGSKYLFNYSTEIPSTQWIYISNESYTCMVYNVNSKPNTFGTYGEYSTFGTVNLSKYPDSYLVDFICINQDYASVYANVINSYITCDSTGDTAPKFANGYTWNNFAMVFSKFSNDVRDLYTGISTNEDIKDFTARYDYIVAKYGYTNFLSRDVSPLASRFNLDVNSEDNSMIIIVVIASVTALAFTTLLIIKKKKHR